MKTQDCSRKPRWVLVSTFVTFISISAIAHSKGQVIRCGDALVISPGASIGTALSVPSHVDPAELGLHKIQMAYAMWLTAEYISYRYMTFGGVLVPSADKVEWEQYLNPSSEMIQGKAIAIVGQLVDSFGTGVESRHVSFETIIELRRRFIQMLVRFEQTPESKELKNKIKTKIIGRSRDPLTIIGRLSQSNLARERTEMVLSLQGDLPHVDEFLKSPHDMRERLMNVEVVSYLGQLGWLVNYGRDSKREFFILDSNSSRFVPMER